MSSVESRAQLVRPCLDVLDRDLELDEGPRQRLTDRHVAAVRSHDLVDRIGTPSNVVPTAKLSAINAPDAVATRLDLQ